MSVPLRTENEVTFSSKKDEIEILCDELNREIEEDKRFGKSKYSDLYHLPSIPREEEKDYVERAIKQFKVWMDDPKKAREALDILQGTIYEDCKSLTKEYEGSWKIAMKVKLFRNWKKAVNIQKRTKSKK